ncbi:Early light-induced protein 1, chloroplastic [Sarracenia purpurea var. burkii]
MATSSAMQSILASSAACVAKRSASNRLVPHSYSPRLQRNASMQVRCMAKDGKEQDSKPATTPVSTKFFDLLAFSGPAPERINGRLAMIGFVAAIAVELSKGEDVFAQISNGGISWFVGTTVVLSLASLVPLFKGVSVESKSDGFMTSDAELWNGRFAMLGLVALAFTEYVKGGALV